MPKEKGIAKTQVDNIWWLVEIIVTVVGIGALVFFLFIYMDPGCGQYSENPQACIRQDICKPTPDEDEDGEITCIRAMRTPNNRYSAPDDAGCVCPDSWSIVLDEEDNYYGMCYKEVGGETRYTTCQYSIHVEEP